MHSYAAINVFGLVRMGIYVCKDVLVSAKSYELFRAFG